MRRTVMSSFLGRCWFWLKGKRIWVPALGVTPISPTFDVAQMSIRSYLSKEEFPIHIPPWKIHAIYEYFPQLSSLLLKIRKTQKELTEFVLAIRGNGSEIGPELLVKMWNILCWGLESLWPEQHDLKWIEKRRRSVWGQMDDQRNHFSFGPV